jgi:hypothetical protein
LTLIHAETVEQRTPGHWHCSGGDVMFGNEWVREEAIKAQLHDYRIERQSALDDGRRDAVDEYDAFIGSLMRAQAAAQRWSLAASWRVAS